MNGNGIDNSGNGNDATVFGTTSTADRFGKANSAIHFNGLSDYVQLGTDADFSQRTISLWFKVDSFPAAGGYSLVFSTDYSTIKYGWTALSVSNTGVNNINSTVGANGKVNANVNKNAWYNYVFWVDGAWVKYFLNGKIVDSLPNNSFTHSNDGDTKAHLGTSRKNNAYFKGSIDDVRIYDCPLSRAEIQKFYTADINKFPKTVSTLNVYPNPTNGKITIENTGLGKNESVLIYSSQGQLLFQQNLQKANAEVDISHLAKGIYIVVLVSDNKKIVSRIVRE